MERGPMRQGSAVVVVSGRFTPDAVRFAEGKPIDLVNADRLIELVQTVRRVSRSDVDIAFRADEVEATTEVPSAITRICPRCGSELVERTARRGPQAGNGFMGCSAYPKCRHTEPV